MFSEIKQYLQTAVFAAIVFAAVYFYITWLGIPRAVNKSMADTAIILMGWSMLLSSVCYFWNFLDKMIIYRKYLGLVGFAFGIAHLVLSWGAFMALFSAERWQNGILWAPLSGTLAFLIFSIMALISNKFSASKLGGHLWKIILRTGYIAVIFVTVHVLALRWDRWMSWANEGFQTLPSMSLLVTLFMVIVLVMRVILWIALKNRKTTNRPEINKTPTAQPMASSNTATITQ